MHFLIVVVLYFGLTTEKPDYQIIKQGNFVGLADADGKTVIYPQYENIGWSDGTFQPLGGVLGYQVNERWGLMALDEKKITSPLYKTIAPFTGAEIKVSQQVNPEANQLFGLISLKGKPLVAQQYNSITHTHGNLIVSQRSTQGIKYGLINYAEKVLIPAEYQHIASINEHMLLLEERDGRQWLCNYAGEKLLPKAIQEIAPLKGADYFSILQGGKIGLLDALGNELIKPNYKNLRLNDDGSLSLESFGLWEGYTLDKSPLVQLEADDVAALLPGFISAKRGETVQLYTTRGTELNSNTFESAIGLEANFYLVKSEGKFGLSHLKNGILLPTKYDTIIFDRNHFYAKTEYWQVYDTSGKLLSSDPIEDLLLDDGDLTPIRVDRQWGYLSSSGKLAVACKFEAVLPFKYDKGLVRFEGKYGAIDLEGKWEILPKYAGLTMVHKNLYIGQEAGVFSLINSFGNILYETSNPLVDHPLGVIEHLGNRRKKLHYSPFQQEFDSISSVQASNFYIVYQEEKSSLLDAQGKVVIPKSKGLEKILPFEDDLIGIKKEGKYGFLDWNGNLWIANQYEAVGAWREERGAVKLLGKWGFVDKRERLVVQPYYDEVFPFMNGISIVRLGATYGLVDNQGVEVLPVSYHSIERLPCGDYLLRQESLYGLAKADGRMTLRPIYDEIAYLGEDLYRINRNAHVGIKNRNNVDVLPLIYEKVRYDAINKIIWGWKSTQSKVIQISQ